MNGLLLKLLDDRTGAPGRWFWKLFRPIRHELDRLYWCFACQPWMGAPDQFLEDKTATSSFDGAGSSSVMLWQPGSLGRFADSFAEEFIELWGIEPMVDDPKKLAAQYSAAAWHEQEGIIRGHARVWLLYTDSACWEVFARKAALLDETRAYLRGKPWVEVYESNSEGRALAFSSAGLASVWTALDDGRAGIAKQVSKIPPSDRDD